MTIGIIAIVAIAIILIGIYYDSKEELGE